MKKTPLCALFIALVMLSCSDNEVAGPKELTENPLNTASAGVKSKPASNGRLRDPNHSITAAGEVTSFAASFVPEELYISEGNAMWAVDKTIGTGYPLNSDQPYVMAMASTGGYIYAVLDNFVVPSNKNLYKINPTTGVYTLLTPGIYWPSTKSMAAAGGYLYMVDGGDLWKVNATTGTRSVLGTHNWTNAKEMAVSGNYLYVVDGILWQVELSSGNGYRSGMFFPSSMSSIVGLAATGNYIYTVTSGSIWRLFIGTGGLTTSSAWETFSANTTWPSTVAMTAVGGYVYAVDVGQLWKVHGTTGATSLLTPSGYTWSGSPIEMAARQ